MRPLFATIKNAAAISASAPMSESAKHTANGESINSIGFLMNGPNRQTSDA
jgi:hypothetical protein